MFKQKKNDLLDSLYPIDNFFEKVNPVIHEVQKSISIDISTNNREYQWSNLPGCHGTYCGNPSQLNILPITTPWPSVNPVLNLPKGDIGQVSHSLELADKIIKNFSIRNRYTVFPPSGQPNILQIYQLNTGTIIENTVQGLLYTIRSLEAGSPVVFGINYNPYNNDNINSLDSSTDHYIIIVGMGNDGRNFFWALDIGSLLCDYTDSKKENPPLLGLSPNNKIYLDKNWPGLLKADSSWSNCFASTKQPYKVTQILRSFVL